MLVKIGATIHRNEHFDENENHDQMCLNLDLLIEKIKIASKKAVAYQQRVARHYSQNVHVR